MEVFIALGIFSLICWAMYKVGKQLGSRKAYGVGRAQYRR